jgi:plastocyanin
MRGTLQIIPSSPSTVPSDNSTLQDTSATFTSSGNTPTNSISSTNDTTIQNLQQQIVSLQQTVDTLQQTLMSLQQAASQGGNVSIPSGNNTSNTAETSTSLQEDLPQQPALSSPILSPQQMPQSQQQQGQQQQNQAVSIVPGSSTLAENTFQPSPVQVSIGDTVTWINDDSQPHTITSGVSGQPDGRFDSSPNFNPLLASGQTFEHTFTEAGDYPYFCQLHPNMVGIVSVVS